MTLAVEPTIAIYDGDDSTTEFSVPCYFKSNDEIVCTLIDADDNLTVLELDTHFTLTGAGTLSGIAKYPKVTDPLTDPMATGKRLSVQRVVPLDQNTNTSARGDNFYNSLDGGLDHLMMAIQQMQEQLNRAPLVSLAYEGSIPDIDTIIGYVSMVAAQAKGSIYVRIEGQLGGVIATGQKKIYLGPMPVDGTLTSATLLADQSGNVVVDIWKDEYANFPPTVADTIIDTGAGGTKPTITAAQKSQDTSLLNWDKNFSAGDIFELNIDSISNITVLIIMLHFDKTGV